MEEKLKLYSNREISIATFFGGPLAAGYLMKKNFQVMGDFNRADQSILIGVVSTILLFVGLYSLPEPIIDKIPQPLIPAIYTAIISLIVNKLQGPFIKTHKENGGSFHSGWKAAGAGAVAMLILLGGIAVVAFFAGDFAVKSDFDSVGYNKEIAKFADNETKAMAVFKVLETSDPIYLKNEFEKGLILWKTNRAVIFRLKNYKNLPKELQTQNAKLLRYCDLRIEQNNLILKTLSENTDKYSMDLNRIGKDIDQIIKELQ